MLYPLSSLRNRLVAAATIWIVIGITAAGFSLSSIFRSHTTTQFHDELAVHLEELDSLLDVDANLVVRLSRPFSDPRYIPPKSGFYWQINRGVDIVARSPSLDGMSIVVLTNISPRSLGTMINGPTGPLIIAEKRHSLGNGPPVQILIGTDSRHIEGLIAQYHASLFRALSAFGISIIIAAIILIVFAMRPFTNLRSSLARVRNGVVPRLSGRFPQEVFPLVEDLNHLIEEAQQTTQRARTQAGNLAHGLKTPLAILTDEAHQLETCGHPCVARLILEQCQKMQVHIDYHIARARVAGKRSSLSAITELAPAVSACTSAFLRLYADRNLQIAIDVRADHRVACDSEDLNEMLSNLIDNACKHATTKLRIAATDEAGFIAISIDDDGGGLTEDERVVAFEVGTRLQADVPGHGLGLPIVRDVARMYGGDVKLEDAPGGGVRAILRLPTRKNAEANSNSSDSV